MSMIGHFLALPQATLDDLREDPEQVPTFLFETHADAALNVEKTWHGIHFLLNGTVAGGSGPLANVVFGRTPVGDDDEMGYGPAMATDAADVPAIAAALAAVTDDQLRQRFDADAMADIYPNIWDEDDALDWLMDYVAPLRAFYDDAAGRGQAVISWLG